MAGIDYNILLQSKGPDWGQAMRDGMSMGQQMNQMNQQKEDKMKQQQIDDAYRSSFTKGADGKMTFDQNSAIGKLAGIQGGGQQAFKAQQEFAQMDQAQQKAQTEKQLEQLRITGQLIGGANDQASWTAARNKAASMGIDTTQVPELYDPGIKRQMQYGTMTIAQQLENDLRQQNMGMERERLNLQKKELEAKYPGGVSAPKLTDGQKKVDTDYAGTYNDFTGGGEAKAVRSLEKLKEYKKVLESQDNNWFEAGGGPISGSMPDMFRTQDSIALRDNIMNEANAGLKATFGGQLSDGERKSAASEYYNDKLDAKQNAKILDRKIQELEGSLRDQQAKARHYEQNRSSLAGYGKVRSELSQSPIGNSNKPSWAL